MRYTSAGRLGRKFRVTWPVGHPGLSKCATTYKLTAWNAHQGGQLLSQVGHPGPVGHPLAIQRDCGTPKFEHRHSAARVNCLASCVGFSCTSRKKYSASRLPLESCSSEPTCSSVSTSTYRISSLTPSSSGGS